MKWRKTGVELLKHAFIWSILVFAFFPMYITLSISVKNNKQFSKLPFKLCPQDNHLGDSILHLGHYKPQR